MDDSNVTLGIAITSLIIVLFIGMVLFLLVLNHNRRHKHRAELAEVRVRHAEEVRRVEQEVTRQTLSDVGRDLHDNIGQLLTVTRMGLNSLIGASADAAKGQRVKDNLDSTIAEVRRLSKTLDRDRWTDLSLEEVVQEECARITRMGGVPVHFKATAKATAMTVDRKVVLYRIFQESVNNALKHAQAKNLHVRMESHDGLKLSVRDDGRGFDPATISDGQGLGNMRRRAELIGYHCEIASTPGVGTTITLIPWNGTTPSP